MTTFRVEISRTETKTSWELMKMNAAHLSGTRVLVNHSRVSPRKNQILFVSQYQSIKKLAWETFWCCWNFLGMPICQVQYFRWTIEDGVTKYVWNVLCPENFREGAIFVFLKVCGIKKLCETGISRSFVESFFSHTTKNFRKRLRWYLYQIWDVISCLPWPYLIRKLLKMLRNRFF